MKTQAQFYASRLAGAAVNMAARTIVGVTIMTIGKAMGHNSVDRITFEQFIRAVGGERVRAREDHPFDDGVIKPLGDLRGYFFNFRIEGPKLVADFQALSEEAGGVESTRLLCKAKEAPDCFGVSPVFFGPTENGMTRIEKVLTIDFVDLPAGADGSQTLFKAEVAIDPTVAAAFAAKPLSFKAMYGAGGHPDSPEYRAGLAKYAARVKK